MGIFPRLSASPVQIPGWQAMIGDGGEAGGVWVSCKNSKPKPETALYPMLEDIIAPWLLSNGDVEGTDGLG